MDKVDFIRIKEDFCSVKTAIKRIKRCHRLGECICKKKHLMKDLYPKCTKESREMRQGGERVP